METSNEDTPRVRAVIERYRQGFAELNGEALRAIWDRDYDDLVYVAMEEERARHGWEAISAYYDGIDSGNPQDHPVAMNLYELSVNVLGDAAYAFCRFEFVGAVDDDGQYTISGRSTFVLRRVDDDWRVIHYHESAPHSAGQETDDAEFESWP